MFISFKSYMSSRVAKAKAQRAAMAATKSTKGTNPYQAAPYEIGILGTLGTVMFLMFIGASMMTHHILKMNPGCLRGGGMNVPTKTTTAMTKPGALAASTPAQATPPPPLVESCSQTVKDSMKRILPADNCYSEPFSQGCSFTVATVKSGCQDYTKYYRQPMAMMKLSKTPFTAVLVGFDDNDGAPMDMLAIGSHDSEKYSMKKWKETVGQDIGCPMSDELTYESEKQPARVFVLDEDQSRCDKMNDYKKRAGFTDEEMTVTKITIPDRTDETCSALDVSTMGDIHFLRLKISGGRDYDFLKGCSTALENVWYIDFGNDWKGKWETGSMKRLLEQTMSSFACYWHGGEGNLFRMTGCWQYHYNFRTWSKVVCVNVKLEGSKPIFEKMEEAFMKTVESGKTY